MSVDIGKALHGGVGVYLLLFNKMEILIALGPFGLKGAIKMTSGAESERFVM